MTLEIFLRTLINLLELNNVRYCVLRNYENLPYSLSHGDIDFLIDEDNIGKIKKLLSEINDIKIIGYTKRYYVHNYFIYNIEKGGDSSALQIDFIFKYLFLGITYIKPEEILNEKIEYRKQCFILYTPSAFHEAMIKFLPYYLSTGAINQRYYNDITLGLCSDKNRFDRFFIDHGLNQMEIDGLFSLIVSRNISSNKFNFKIKMSLLLWRIKIYDVVVHFLTELGLRCPLANCKIVKVSLNPEDIAYLKNKTEYFAKNVFFIKLSLLNLIKIFKINKSYALFIIYKTDKSINKDSVIHRLVEKIHGS